MKKYDARFKVGFEAIRQLMGPAKPVKTLLRTEAYERLGKHVNWRGDVAAYFNIKDTIWADANSGDVRVPATGDGYSTQFYEETLEPFLAAGKVVLSVDYAQQAANVTEAYQRASANGYVPCVALRALDRLTSTPPPGYPGD